MSRLCRHGTAVERCPICAPALAQEIRSAGAGATRTPTSRRAARANTPARPPSTSHARSRLTVRHEARAEDDGYRNDLVSGLRSSADAQRLAAEIAYACGRLTLLAADPPGLYATVATESDIEQASWLALLIVYLGPLEGPDPFATIRAAQTPWSSQELPLIAPDAALGPRCAHDPARGTATLDAYRRWAQRAGSQAQAFTGDASWTEQQRFERVFERLALPGLHRRARFDLLVTLGRLGRYPLRAGSLLLAEEDVVLTAAKRVFGIGDRLTLERRARTLADAVGAPIDALDLALENWSRPDGPISLGARICAQDVHEQALLALDCAP